MPQQTAGPIMAAGWGTALGSPSAPVQLLSAPVQMAKTTKGSKGGKKTKVTKGIKKPSKTVKPIKTSIIKNVLTQGWRKFDVDFGPLRNGCATRMRANIRLNDVDDLYGMGSSPSVQPPWWGAMSAAVSPFASSYLVQGHLLNDNIGGPGDNMQNLTPITKSANSTHNKKVEEKVKKAFRSKGFYQIEYDVEADYSSPPTAKDMGAPKSIAPWLKNFPRAIHAEFAVWKKVGKKFVNRSAGEKRWTIHNDHKGLK